MMFIRRIVEVEARQVEKGKWKDLAAWCGGEIVKDGNSYYCICLKGGHQAFHGSWIIKHNDGQFEIMPNNIFVQWYEAT